MHLLLCKLIRDLNRFLITSNSIAYIRIFMLLLLNCLRDERTLEESISLEWFTDQSSTNYWRLLSPSGLIHLLPIPDPISVRLTGQGPSRTASYSRVCNHFFGVHEGIQVTFSRFYSNLHGLIPMRCRAMDTLVRHLLSLPQTANFRVLLPAKCMIVNNWYCFGHY